MWRTRYNRFCNFKCLFLAADFSSSKNRKTFNGELPSKESIQAELLRGENPYLKFIAEARARTDFLLEQNPDLYTELHHIVPRHEGGTDEPDNLVHLTYTDHIIAHYIRYLVYNNQADKLAYSVMMGQEIDVRKERARLGGLAGGKVAQQKHRERGIGWFDSQGQSLRGKEGAEVNRIQGTGAFDPTNLEKANKALEIAKKNNPEHYNNLMLDNLSKGRQTQKSQGINLGDRVSQRLKSLKRFGFIVLNGKPYLLDHEQRTYVCETTLEYYLRYAPKKT